MIKPNLVLVLFFCLFFAASTVVAGEVGVKKLHKADWIQLETDNFLVITDAGEKKPAAMTYQIDIFI